MSNTGVEAAEAEPEPEVLTIGRKHSRQPRQWGSIAAALMAGLFIGRLSVVHLDSHDETTQVSTSQAHATAVAEQGPDAVDAPGCPPYRTCTSRKVHAPGLIRTLASNFPDLVGDSIVVTDDSATGDRYRVRLTATLARGLTLELIADNAAAAPAVATPWVFVAVGHGRRPDHATRTMITDAGNGPAVHITIAVSNDATPSGRADTGCDCCRHTISRSEAAARLQGLSRVGPRTVLTVIAGGLRAAHDSNALSWFS